jgi:periplasmic divalent cation tolerance protein
MTSSPMMVYVTVGNIEEAKKIAQNVVTAKLAACANILPSVTSIYHWEGDLQEDQETVMVLKTTSSNVPKLTDMIKDMHSYECPCIVSIPIQGGNDDFLNWIDNETLSL